MAKAVSCHGKKLILESTEPLLFLGRKTLPNFRISKISKDHDNQSADGLPVASAFDQSLRGFQIETI